MRILHLIDGRPGPGAMAIACRACVQSARAANAPDEHAALIVGPTPRAFELTRFLEGGGIPSRRVGAPAGLIRLALRAGRREAASLWNAQPPDFVQGWSSTVTALAGAMAGARRWAGSVNDFSGCVRTRAPGATWTTAGTAEVGSNSPFLLHSPEGTARPSRRTAWDGRPAGPKWVVGLAADLPPASEVDGLLSMLAMLTTAGIGVLGLLGVDAPGLDRARRHGLTHPRCEIRLTTAPLFERTHMCDIVIAGLCRGGGPPHTESAFRDRYALAVAAAAGVPTFATPASGGVFANVPKSRPNEFAAAVLRMTEGDWIGRNHGSTTNALDDLVRVGWWQGSRRMGRCSQNERRKRSRANP